jgi:transposase-like protein
VSHAIHPNAALTPKARLRLARLVVEQNWTISQAARRFEVCYRTAKRWVVRYLEMGAAGMQDRSSRPLHHPNRTPRHLVGKIVALRWRRRLGPVEIGARLQLAASTVHAVLVRCRLNRLSHIDRHTGEPIRRYERTTRPVR